MINHNHNLTQASATEKPGLKLKRNAAKQSRVRLGVETAQFCL